MFDRLRDRVSPRLVDGAIAIGLALFAVFELLLWWPADAPMEVAPWSFPLALTMTLPLVVRRRYPNQVMAVVGIAGIAAPVLGSAMPNGAAVGIMVALYSVAAYGNERDAIGAGMITMGVLLFIAVRYWDVIGITGATANYLIFGTVWAVGWASRNRRLLLAELAARAELAELTREQEAQRAVAAERARIARELHDVVAHTVSVMVVQAGAARRQLEHHPGAARGAIAAVENTGRTALDELRRLLGILRQEAPRDARTLAPQPTLRAVEPLVQTIRDAGVPVELTIDGSLDDLPAGVDVSAYRVVQEALTNVLKHAGTPDRVEVRIRRTSDDVVIEIHDDGRGLSADAPAPRGEGAGQGLVGMRERVSLYGGKFRAGHRSGGGFVVRASFPFRRRPSMSVR